MTETPEKRQRTVMEVRRGALSLAVLLALGKPHYGYSLRKKLAAEGLEIDEGTLYPLLRRLEEQGLLSSYWQQEEGRKRRFYQIAADGEVVRTALHGEWQGLNRVIGKLAQHVEYGN
ncbi:helix-turn-helix transcriptional regulator [Microbulbifer elongatus]|uniref:Helix-turn-helix transcriptional regulator n=1 Tax=Microbulbifer elongatus TaxID=86173 RepID=A0ABT1P4V2_9GAMM|nr:PadR family transcriptional regulator [Microbulbifer elongatus]MCQ3831132.1 helix-turn-helix transcriptional regulator [Microbulbifer elongatus]